MTIISLTYINTSLLLQEFYLKYKNNNHHKWCSAKSSLKWLFNWAIEPSVWFPTSQYMYKCYFCHLRKTFPKRRITTSIINTIYIYFILLQMFRLSTFSTWISFIDETIQRISVWLVLDTIWYSGYRYLHRRGGSW